VFKVYKEYAFQVLKKYRKLLGRRRLTRRLLNSLYRTDRQFIYLPFGDKNVVYDPYGDKLDEYLRKKTEGEVNGDL
jgi:hypothetical protein